MNAKKVKLVLIGDSRVGKTSLRKKFMGDGFKREYAATLGADFSVKRVFDHVVTIIDLAGDDASKDLRSQYYMGVQGFILVFDVTNPESFNNLATWFNEIKNFVHDKLRVFILGNKDDLRDDNLSVGEDKAYQYARNLELVLGSTISYLSTSALTGYNVETAFNKLITEIIFN